MTREAISCATCELLKFEDCVCLPYDENVARRRFLLEDPPTFVTPDLVAATARDISALPDLAAPPLDAA